MASMTTPQEGEAALVRAVRALDQGDIETLPDKLERLWNILPGHRGGAFHAAEEMLVRWLLKNMTGNTANAERVRRYPLAWNILGAVFTCVPLFSLAKSLADRRFVIILQQTLKEISGPQDDSVQANGTDSDVEMADAPAQGSAPNPRKRKRSSPSSFDIAAQRQLDGCLQTSEAVFEAIRILLCRCELKSLAEGSPNHRMGAEHIKSLFSSPASEAVATLVPLLTICNLAATQPSQQLFREQSTWISTFNALWDLRLQAADDTSHVAINLSVPGMGLLDKVMGVSQPATLGVDATVKEQWTRDLGRFLARNLILPCRASFLNGKDQANIQHVVNLSSVSAAQTYPVLFDLVTRSSRVDSDKSSKKDYEVWTQAVFDIILEALKSNRRERSQAAIETIMEMAAERNLALPASSLRIVCKEFALKADQEKWGLLLPIVKLNPDVFLLSEEGEELLQQALKKTHDPGLLSSEDLNRASQFIVALAHGYAEARDLSSFIKIWAKYLQAVGPKANPGVLWAQPQLSQTIASYVEKFLNTNQLVEILDSLASSGDDVAGAATRIHIVDALSAGIKHEEFVDAANMKTFDTAYSDKISRKDLSDSLSVLRWGIAAYCLPRGTLEDAGRIWSRIKQDAEHVLRRSWIRKQETYIAFQCCIAVWLANHPHGPDEKEVGDMVCTFVDDLIASMARPDAKNSAFKGGLVAGDYVNWMLSESARAMGLIGMRNGLFPLLIALSLPQDPGAVEAVPDMITRYRPILDNENNLNDQKLMGKILESYISGLESSTTELSSLSTKKAIQFLLATPKELLSRSQRETVMKSLLSKLPRKPSHIKHIGLDYWRQVVSLMVKLMGMPTFYEGMKFKDLKEIGLCTLNLHGRGGESPQVILGERLDLKIIGELATLSVRQMTSGTLEEREKRYLTEASVDLQTPYEGPNTVLRLILLRSFLQATQDSPAPKQLKDWDSVTAQLKKAVVSHARPTLEKEWHGRGLLSSLFALEALDLLDGDLIKKAVGKDISTLVEASSKALDSGFETLGWEVRMFLAKHYPDALGFPLRMVFPKQPQTDGVLSTSTVDKSALLQYVDAVVRDANDETKLGYLEKLLDNDKSTEPASLGELMVIYRLLQHVKSPRDTPTTSNFSLSQTHSILCNQLLHTSTVPEFILTAKAIYLLLDQRSWCMTQWNIEVTLSTVSTIASKIIPGLAGSSKTYQWLCRLVEIVIKRHRIRLDGHFHILITALQSLLRRLISQASENSEAHAKLFARLLMLVCEPTDASVSRSKAAGGLDSERDRAKRYAGQYMYLVLMQYVKLQLEYAVSHGVREALETGMYSVLDITTQDGMKLMNDAMDPSGRVIFREVYKQYQRFGKWSGV